MTLCAGDAWFQDLNTDTYRAVLGPEQITVQFDGREVRR